MQVPTRQQLWKSILMSAFQALVLVPGVLETYDCQWPGSLSHRIAFDATS